MAPDQVEPSSVEPSSVEPSSADLAAFVLANSQLRPVPQVPEVSLHLACDAYVLWEETERTVGQTDQPPPFWAFPWPGGQALARYILDHPALVSGRTVLDLGSGSGLTAIASALAGATAVLASELDPFAIAAIKLNATANQVTIAATGDVLDGNGEDADVILAADVWYEKRLAERALGLLQRARDRGAGVLVGDVGRAFLPRSLMRDLAAYQMPVIAELEDATMKRVLVLTLAGEAGEADDASEADEARGARRPGEAGETDEAREAH